MLSDESKAGLNVAFNEATLLGAEVDLNDRVAALTLNVLTLPEEGPPPDDCRIQVLMSPIGRVAASLYALSRDGQPRETEVFELSDLLQVVQTFRQPIYGWRFFDMPEDFETWKDRVSFDHVLGEDGRSHSLTVLQDTGNRALHLRIWFDTLICKRANGDDVPLNAVIAGGRRWWDALYAGDPRTDGAGIVALAPNGDDRN